MRNKIFKSCLLSLVTVYMLSGCGKTNSSIKAPKFEIPKASYSIVESDDRFLRIDSMDGWIYVDKNTGVQYLWVSRGYSGGLTTMLDSDGKPLLYKGDVD